MLSSKRNVLTVSAVIAAATMATGLGTTTLIAGSRATKAPAVAHALPAAGPSWADDEAEG
jgi:hypothetical protein